MRQILRRAMGAECRGPVSALDVREIGRRLNVRTVLEGSIRKAGDRLRITAQLIDVDEGYHLWSEKFDRSLADIFDIQDEVAAAVVGALKVRLLAGEKAAIGKRHTTDPETYALYLKGRHFFSRPSAENLERALGYYQQAVEREPGFAPAWVGIAEIYVAVAILALSAPKDAWAKAKAAIQRALAIDEDLPEAHGLAAVQAVYYDWDWAAAERSYRKALALNRGNVLAHANYAWFCAFMGRFDEAVAEVKPAVDLDPLMPLLYAFSVGVHRYAGRLDEAIAEFHKAIELDPRSGLAYFHAGTAYFAKGMLDEAREAFERSLELVVFSGWAEGFLGCVHVAQGRRDAAERLLQSMLDKRQRMYVSAVCVALLSWQLGKADQAFEYFDKALDDHDSIMPLVNIPVFPFSGDLRREPRFQALLDRMRVRAST